MSGMGSLWSGFAFVMASVVGVMSLLCLWEIRGADRKARRWGLVGIGIGGLIGAVGWGGWGINISNPLAIGAVGVGLVAEYGFLISTPKGRKMVFEVLSPLHAGWAGRLALGWPLIASSRLARVALQIAGHPEALQDEKLIERIMEVGGPGSLVRMIEASEGELLEQSWPQLVEANPEKALAVLQEFGAQAHLSESLITELLESSNPDIRQAGLRIAGQLKKGGGRKE